MMGRSARAAAAIAVCWPLFFCSAFHSASDGASLLATRSGDRHLQKLQLYRHGGGASSDAESRTGFDMWDSPHVAGGNSAIGGNSDPGPILWQYAHHGNWMEVLTRVRQHPTEARYIRDNGWTTLHLLVAGNANPVPLEVVRAVYDAFPAALDVRTKDYKRSPKQIAERWKQPQVIIEFLSNPDDADAAIELPSNDAMENTNNDDAKGGVAIDTTPASSSTMNTATSTTYSTQTPPIMASITDSVHEYQQQPPPWMTGGANSGANRHSKPLTADAIVITSLQSQHNNFLKNQMSELKQINEDLAETLHSDIDQISALETDNSKLKESEAQTRAQLEDALQRMKHMEENLQQKYQNEVDRRVSEAETKLKADADRRVSEVQSAMQAEANRKFSEIKASMSIENSTSKDADTAEIKEKLQKTVAELASIKEQLQNAKTLEGQMRNAVVVANTEAESLVMGRDKALKAEQKMKVMVISANAKADEAQRSFTNLEEQSKEAKTKFLADIESVTKQHEAKTSHLKKELKRLEEEKEEYRCSALSSNDKVRTTQKRLDALEVKAEQDEAQIMSLKEAIESTKQSKEQMRKAVESANVEFKEALKRWEGLESQAKNLAASERSLLAQVERLRLQLREKQMEYQVLNEEKEVQRKDYELRLYKAKNGNHSPIKTWHD